MGDVDLHLFIRIHKHIKYLICHDSHVYIL